MVKRHRVCMILGVLIFLSAFVLAACSKPPTEEMAKAEKAIQDAKQTGAPAYVPELFAKAEASLQKAKDHVAEKSYKEAKQIAIETEALGQQAAAVVGPAKAKMKADAEQAVQDVQKTIDELKSAVEGAAKKKPLATARDEATALITKWEADLTAVKEKLQADTIKEANDALKVMKDEVNAKKEAAVSALSAPPAKK